MTFVGDVEVPRLLLESHFVAHCPIHIAGEALDYKLGRRE